MIIVFNHREPEGKLSKKIRRITLALVKDQGEIIASGESRCSIKDIFNKETGRILALREATKDLSKELKEQVWKKYVNRKTVNLKKSEMSLVSST